MFYTGYTHGGPSDVILDTYVSERSACVDFIDNLFPFVSIRDEWLNLWGINVSLEL